MKKYSPEPGDMCGLVESPFSKMPDLSPCNVGNFERFGIHSKELLILSKATSIPKFIKIKIPLATQIA